METITQSEDSLIVRCQKGERQAQYEVYRQYSTAMYNICYRMLNHQAEAEDALQEAFLTAFQNISSYRGDASLGAWLKRIVVNRCINHLRKRKTQLVHVEDHLPDLPDEPSDDSNLVLEIDRIRKAIQQLPDGFRIVFSLYLLEGYDHTEIAQILHISESTSKSQYNRAKKKLREILLQM